MALLLFIPTSQVGVAFSAAYAKISHYHGQASTVVLHVAIFASTDARYALAQPVDMRVHEMPLPADAPLLPAAYEFLKTLPEYADATDC
jgi:hypothetical protein